MSSAPSPANFLSDTYRKYKVDTNIVVQWLASTATGLGYNFSVRTKKGKSTKRTKQASQPSKSTHPPRPPARYQNFGVDTFVELAEFLSQRAKSVTVPGAMVKRIHRADAERKRCAKWFHQREGRTAVEIESDAKHWHFIEVLEEVVGILEPLAKEKKVALGKLRELQAEQCEMMGSERSSAYRYELLEEEGDGVDGTDTEDDWVNPTVNAVSTPSSTAAKPLTSELKTDDTMFTLFCYFQDLRSIRSFILDIWSDYKLNKTNLMTVSATTNTALDFIRTLSKQVESLLPKWESDWRQLDSAFCPPYQPFRGTGMEQAGEDDYVTPFSNSSFLHTLSILEGFCSRLQQKRVPGAPSCPLVLRNRASMSFAEHLEVDKALLLQVLSDITLHIAISDKREFKDHFLLDELSKELAILCRTKMVSFLAVYASYIFLDIHHFLGNSASHGFTELESECHLIIDSTKERPGADTRNPTIKPTEREKNFRMLEAQMRAIA
ncbi:hypothetical protein HDV00_004693 [Rhizophlyctis rosea]|nr:hypothetical protein HDV00_004693 [Rhizophlyctis rosea]